MFCRYCGNELPDDARFCSRCGRSTTPSDPPVEERRKGPATTNWPRYTQQADPSAGKRGETHGTTGWPKDKKPAAPTGEPSFAGTQASFDNARKAAGTALTGSKGKAKPTAKRLLSWAKSHKLAAAASCAALAFGVLVALSISNDIYFSIQRAKIAARIEAAKASQSASAGGSGSSGERAPDPSSSDGSRSTEGTVKADKSSTAVPDLGAFLGCARRDDTKSSDIYSYTFDDVKGLAAVDEYRALLTGSYNFREVNFKEEEYPSSGLICYHIYYSYTGSGSVGSKRWPSAEQEANIFLLVNHYTWEDRVGVSMHLGDGLTVENSGKTASDPPTDMSGASGSGSGSGGSDSGVYTPEFAKLDCSICKGTGDCQTCGGRGYLYSSASKKYDRNCTSCGTTGKCRYCGGTGKR